MTTILFLWACLLPLTGAEHRADCYLWREAPIRQRAYWPRARLYLDVVTDGRQGAVLRLHTEGSGYERPYTLGLLQGRWRLYRVDFRDRSGRVYPIHR